VWAEVGRERPAAEDELGAFKPFVEHGAGRLGQFRVFEQAVVEGDRFLEHHSRGLSVG
jgi:hypothetical protein